MAIDDEVLGWIRGAVVAESWHSVGQALRAHDPGGDDPRLSPFVIAFEYTLHEAFSSARERAGGPFGAVIAGDGWRFPPALSDITDEEVEAWGEGLTLVDHPVAQARLGDLLWERKWRPDPHLAAGASCDGLLTLAEDSNWNIMDRVRCLSRALELARGTRDTTRKPTVIAQMLSFAEQDLSTPNGGPGVSLGVLRPLVALPANERPDGLDQLLARVAEKYGADTHIIDSVTDERSRLLGQDEAKQLRKDQVERWRVESSRGDGMLRVHRLERALEIARTHGLRTEADELRRELGTIDSSELGLQRITADMEFPADEAERFVQSFADAPTWQLALRMLAAEGPPGGSPDELGQRVDQIMEDFPVQFLVYKDPHRTRQRKRCIPCVHTNGSSAPHPGGTTRPAGPNVGNLLC